MRKNKIISVVAMIAILSCVLGVSSFAADASDNVIKPWGDRIAEGLGNLVLGMLVVFSVMAILCIILTFTGKFFAAQDKKATTKKSENASAPAPVVEETSADNEEEIVAAITAAITCVLASEGTPAPAFRVVSFKKTNTKKSWNNVD